MKQYFDYTKKVLSWLNRLAKDQSICRLWLYYDYLISIIVHGCLIRQYVIGGFWKLSYQERRKRLTYPRIVKLFSRFNDPAYVHFLNEKSDFNQYFADFIKRGWLHSAEVTEEQFIRFVRKHDSVIIKPIAGVEGYGVRKFVLSKNPDIDLGKLFNKLQAEDVLVEEIIIQHPQMVFGNTSVNTIRTHTILDKNGKGHVIKAILRAGVGDSVVDNYCQGGAIYEVDLETGLVCTYGLLKTNFQSYIHPKTDIVMLGYQIPLWEEVIKVSENAAEHLPQIRIIGWDIAITGNGIELIEGNHNPDYEFIEFLGSTGYYEKIKALL